MEECDYLTEMTTDVACRPHMVIDAGWQQNYTSHRYGSYIGGPWEHGNSGLSDIAGTAEAIHAHGARAGIWIRPLITCGNIPPEAVGIRKCDGGGVPLDPSHPYVREMIAADASALAEIARSEAVYRYLPTFLYEQRYDDAAVAIERMSAECFDTKESILLAVCLREEPVVVDKFVFKRRWADEKIG
jgi:hypothetical protein